MASSISNGDVGISSQIPPAVEAVLGKQPTLEEAAAAQMAQLDLEGNKLPTPAPSKTNGSAENGTVRESASRTSAQKSRPTTRSLSTSQAFTASSRTSSTTRSASSSRKSSQQSMSPTTATTPEIKKLPMNKIVVGTTPSPNVGKVSSKIGSLNNTTYKAGGGNVKIESKKLQWKAESKIGSMQNVKHQAGGGNIKIETQKVDFKSQQSKIGSLQNVKHRAGGGDKKIFDDKEYLKQQKSATASKPTSVGGSKGSSMKGSVDNLVDNGQ